MRARAVRAYVTEKRRFSSSFRELRRVWDDSLLGEDVEVAWSFHPLEEGAGASLNVSEALLEADLVVTDYSSIVYEAYVLGKRAAFYVPDIDDTVDRLV